MSKNTTQLLCPNCKYQKFYIDTESGFSFFKVADSSGAFVFEPLEIAAFLESSLEVNCVNCAWHGSITELVPEPSSS